MRPDVTIAISTLGDRLSSLPYLPSPGIRYLLLVQSPVEGLALPTDPSVKVVYLDSLGLSHSRNAALTHCETDFLLFADDDHVLDIAGIQALAGVLELDRCLSFAVGQRSRSPKDPFPTQSEMMSRWNTGRVCAPELMVRVADIQRRGVNFDIEFGVGAPHPLGEDYIFVTDMLAAGCKGRRFPIHTGRHEGRSSGDDWHSPIILRARQAVLQRVFRRIHIPVRIAYTMRHWHKFSSIGQAVAFGLGL